MSSGCQNVDERVAILLCTYNGQKYLAEQLDSILSQTYKNWRLFVSDDGSSDETCEILRSYEKKWIAGKFSLFSGPRRGFASNFLFLICRSEVKSAYYAFSDQDDIWEPFKIERGVTWLKSVPDGVPAMYCSRTRLVDANNNEIGLSPLFSRPPSFRNALMQNIGGGNTIMINDAARNLLLETGDSVPIVSHDWWVYLVVTGCGGLVYYDSVPTLRYRQHDKNLVGMNSTWGARAKRMAMLWQGRFRYWNDCNIESLRAIEHRLTPENREIFSRFVSAREMGLVSRLINLKRCGLYRQSFLANLGLVAAAIFKRL